MKCESCHLDGEKYVAVFNLPRRSGGWKRRRVYIYACAEHGAKLGPKWKLMSS